MLGLFIHDRVSIEEGPMVETTMLQKNKVLVLDGCAQRRSRTKMAPSPLTQAFFLLQSTQARHGTEPTQAI